MTAAVLAVRRAQARPPTPPRREPPAASCLVLHPGDVACVDRGARLATLLGSCVSILLADPRRSIGAMCHYVHVARFGGGGATALRPT
ncbi:MAG: hypothetical protein WCK28_23765, partial [Burkholderiales bacterium]